MSEKFTWKVAEEKPENEKIVREGEFKNLNEDEISDTILGIHNKVELDTIVGMEKNPNFIYKLEDYIVLKGNTSSKEFILEIEKRGKLGEFMENYKDALQEKLKELNLNKDVGESFNIDSWHQHFYVFDENKQEEGMGDETTPTEFMHDRNVINDGKSNF